MANPENYYFSLPAAERPEPFALNEQRVPGYLWFDEHRSRSRGGHPINKVTTVVVHATAGYATQHALDTWRIRTASAHWIVPDEDEPQHSQFVWAVISESLAAYHVKDSKTHPDIGNQLRVNDYSLGIEIVNTQDVQQYSDPYSGWQVEQTARIVRYAWARYPNLKHVISHARIDPVNRADPGSNFPWESFKAKVMTAGNDPQPVAHASTLKPISAFPQLDPETRGGCCP